MKSTISLPGLIALALIGLYWFARRGQMKKEEALKRSGLLPQDGEPTIEHVHKLIAAREMIEAIKVYRRIHGCDLRTAKEAVEKLRDEG